jgi:hypothetical protein
MTDRKVFRALTANTVEKRFVAVGDATPDGWRDAIDDALSDYKETQNVRKEETPEAAEEVKPRRGRPRKGL